MSNGTEMHNEICNRFRDEYYSKEFIEKYTDEGCSKINKVILEDIISNNNILIGYCDVVINYEDNNGRQQKALIEVKSSANVINKDPQNVLRQIKKYRFYNKKFTKSFLVYTSEETYENVEDIGLFANENITVIDIDNNFVNKQNYYFQDGGSNWQPDRIEDIIEPEESREKTALELIAELTAMSNENERESGQLKKIDIIPNIISQEAPPQAGDVWTESVTGMEFVWVQGGSFMMGSDAPEAHKNEKPVHKVRLDGLWIGKYPVTQGQWQQIMGSNPSQFKSGDDFPVEMVSWDDARQFISRLNQQSGRQFALPTEAQWEYAARSGGKDEKYAGGNDVDAVAWYEKNSGGKTHPVGTKASNSLGIYDMSGNVWEWCEDVYEHFAYSFSEHVLDNPVTTWNIEFTARVVRGGSCNFDPNNVRAAYRTWLMPDHRVSYLGFRLSLPQVRQE